jgi:hypothetical protein
VRSVAAAALAALTIGAGACAGSDVPEPQHATAADSAVAVPEHVQHEVARIGEEAAQALRAGLSQRLMSVIADDGPAAAIDVCALEAMPLTDSIGAATGLELKRTSLRIRNSRNAPDSLEMIALQWFAEHDAEGAASLVQADGADYRYYAALRTAALCTQCHGPVESLDASVRAVLREQYPDDRAVGYREGELRGLIRITVPAEAARQGVR